MSEPTMIENKARTEEEAASVQVAEESRELDWKSKSFLAAIFMGDFDISMVLPFPEQDPEDAAIGDALCARIEAWASENIDGEQIDLDQEIPAHVFYGLNELGLWGCKIPKKYGGLGLSPLNYLRVLGALTNHCASVAGTLSAHQSIGVPQPIKLFGTEEQKQRFLPRLAKGALSAFALTEPNAGSDPAAMTTFAKKSEDGSHWILNGEKLWCTNGAIADLLVVMAGTAPIQKRGREVKQISAFVVEADSPGVQVLHRSMFMGIRGIENAVIRFTDVKVPAENLIWGEGKGLRLALTTLNDGRLGIPAIAAAAALENAEFLTRWAKTREQWGKPIGRHEAGAVKIAEIAGGAYAMEAFSRYTGAVAQRGDVDIRMEAAAAKLYNSERGWELADLSLQLRGGRGYEQSSSLRARGEHPFPMERIMRDARINRIVEGTTEVMHLFLAREALDKHLSLAGALFDSRASVGKKLRAVARAGLFYSTWYPRLWLGGIFCSFGQFDSRLASHMRFVDRRCRKLARTLFHKMLTHGPKLEMRQLTLARIVEIGVELSVMAVTAARLQGEIARGDDSNVEAAIYWLARSRSRVDRLFHEIRHNNDAKARKLADKLLNEAETLPELDPVVYPPRVQERGSDLTSGRQTERASTGAIPFSGVKAS
jgi:alkylation response protein AidB-like acyl-CoA dehydrogenase